MRARAKHEHHLDVQRLKHGDVLEQGGETGLLKQGAINGDDEDALTELRHVAQDPAEVFEAWRGGFSGVGGGRGHAGSVVQVRGELKAFFGMTNDL